MKLTQIDPGLHVLCLDFDGTLVDIADSPKGIHVPADLLPLLAQLYERFGGRVAIVSGREVSAIESFLPGFPGDIHGAHGAEARIDGKLVRHPMVGSDTVRSAQDRARDLVEGQTGLLLETKDTGAVVHYRKNPDLKSKVQDTFGDIIDTAPDLTVHHSKMALELRPADVSKGVALRRIMERQPHGIRPIVVGDDVTDEEAMEVALTMDGICIKIGDGDTVATHRLADPASLRAVLQAWAKGNS